MRPRTWMLVLCGLPLAACGHGASPPSACTRGPDAVRGALRRAPEAVRIGGVPLSRCVADASDSGELQAVGVGLVGAAADLASEARRGPGRDAALRLGYLIGAARRGAGRERGLRSELLRRLEQESQAVGRGPSFQRGLQAGRRDG